ncbi:Sterile alpha motif domain-containing protein, putative isoform 1 [Cucumis melo var. makuwa]|uniref:Sterile alpha motif domain-containing protein, putative isoform 1 n=1 Tax=Cucumis melo var. makuwa TaxID=1194695 RepID=A0A5D3CAT4_CUCMM|nr:Sterile alpha motif domain-containing protein, putative isoform 1 [Cucumis melo var. makuwa]TYK07456.1 Sterile alpha motif domain-containing protein, putative isoform 1 [Cucumis melo var. makuwa]
MVKTKQKQNSNPNHLSGSSNYVIDLDMHGDDSWVVVKKQKITILVPPISVVTKSSTPDAGQSQLQPITQKVSNCQTGALEETRIEAPANVLPSSSENANQQSSKSAAAHCTLTRKEPLKQAVTPPNPDNAFNSRSYKVLGLSNSTKSMKQQPRQLHCPGGFLAGGTLLNQRLRALNLERKLQKAGGLSRWLESLGLDQFVGIFKRKSITKFHLDLTDDFNSFFSFRVISSIHLGVS